MKYSIITVCLNSVSHIEKTIKSVQSQIYDDYEYIIIDGKSTDGTIETICKYKDDKMIFVSEKDQGISDAFNKGIALSTGDYLFFLNSGDFWVKNTVLLSADKELENDNVDIMTFSVVANEVISPASFKDANEMWELSLIPHQATFIRKNVFEKVGLFNKQYKIRMDYDFFVRCRANECSFGFRDEVITDYDMSGISSTNKKGFAREGLAIKLLNNLKLTDLDSEEWNYIVGNSNESKDDIQRRDHQILEIMEKWMICLERGGSIANYFLEKKIKNIAIYGYGVLGKRLHAELSETEVKVKYIIDKYRKRDIKESACLDWEDEWPGVDAIVVTPMCDLENLMKSLRERVDFSIIGISEIFMNI